MRPGPTSEPIPVRHAIPNFSNQHVGEATLITTCWPLVRHGTAQEIGGFAHSDNLPAYASDLITMGVET